MEHITIDALMGILERASGSDEGVDLTTDIADTDFEQLGYESLAILEAAGLIEREYDVVLDESALSAANTPRELASVVNDAISAELV